MLTFRRKKVPFGALAGCSHAAELSDASESMSSLCWLNIALLLSNYTPFALVGSVAAVAKSSVSFLQLKSYTINIVKCYFVSGRDEDFRLSVHWLSQERTNKSNIFTVLLLCLTVIRRI
ncbi:hypothetical protein FQA47_008227 [Oryzias melastigma]|uniref:Uncharacterized protein n=1 Tax=Oryzias melastigma TaxID=30732 RepID=A0A834C044_ORYME|nr:hypothetical protein FQA47_008227 [Oryzias melastigma]